MQCHANTHSQGEKYRGKKTGVYDHRVPTYRKDGVTKFPPDMQWVCTMNLLLWASTYLILNPVH